MPAAINSEHAFSFLFFCQLIFIFNYSLYFYILWSCKEVFIVQSRHDLTDQTHTETFLKSNFYAFCSFFFFNVISLS